MDKNDECKDCKFYNAPKEDEKPWCRRFPMTPIMVTIVNQLSGQAMQNPIGVTAPCMPNGACGEFKPALTVVMQ